MSFGSQSRHFNFVLIHPHATTLVTWICWIHTLDHGIVYVCHFFIWANVYASWSSHNFAFVVIDFVPSLEGVHWNKLKLSSFNGCASTLSICYSFFIVLEIPRILGYMSKGTIPLMWIYLLDDGTIVLTNFLWWVKLEVLFQVDDGCTCTVGEDPSCWRTGNFQMHTWVSQLHDVIWEARLFFHQTFGFCSKTWNHW